MLNWLLRYDQVRALAEELQPALVLDVGSGWHGLSWYWPGTVVNVDLAFAAEAPPDEASRSGRVHLAQGSLAALPFADASVELVVCLDTVEHLPAGLRDRALAELLRVGRTVVVGFPEGEVAARADRRTDHIIARLGSPRPLWLEEHLRQSAYPTEAALRAALPPGTTVTRRGNSNVGVHLVVLALEHQRVARLLTRGAEHWARRHGVPRWVHRASCYRAVYVLQPAPAQRPGTAACASAA